jgi:hypothetical protein
MRDDHTAGESMIRETFSAPNLIGSGDDDPLLDRARALVDEDFPDQDERAERAGKTRPKQ